LRSENINAAAKGNHKVSNFPSTGNTTVLSFNNGYDEADREMLRRKD
jgi:hypothetical protein